MKKFIYSKKGKFITIAVQLIAAVVMVVSFCSVFLFTTITIPNSFGDFKYTIDFFNTDTEYEDSDYFHTMLSNQVSEMIRYAVIRNQMETDGVFNGKKVIDIEEYAKRYESVKKNYISAPYYLEDLIKWGQYGIEYVNEEQQSVNDSADRKSVV